jgi:hypothetical protein
MLMGGVAKNTLGTNNPLLSKEMKMQRLFSGKQSCHYEDEILKIVVF